MRKILLIVLLTFSGQIILAQNDSSKIVGTYQWCPFHCETIKLNNNFTFDYLLDGDLFNKEKTSGVWKFVDKNTIYLKSPDRKLISKSLEKQGERSDGKILIQVTDVVGGVLLGIIIKTKYFGNEKQFVTDENGICEIPETDEIEIIYTRFSEKYRIQNKKTNRLDFELPATNEPYLDNFYQFKNNQLFWIRDDESISEDGFKKLSDKISKKLFPKD